MAAEMEEDTDDPDGDKEGGCRCLSVGGSSDNATPVFFLSVGLLLLVAGRTSYIGSVCRWFFVGFFSPGIWMVLLVQLHVGGFSSSVSLFLCVFGCLSWKDLLKGDAGFQGIFQTLQLLHVFTGMSIGFPITLPPLIPSLTVVVLSPLLGSLIRLYTDPWSDSTPIQAVLCCFGNRSDISSRFATVWFGFIDPMVSWIFFSFYCFCLVFVVYWVMANALVISLIINESA